MCFYNQIMVQSIFTDDTITHIKPFYAINNNHKKLSLFYWDAPIEKLINACNEYIPTYSQIVYRYFYVKCCCCFFWLWRLCISSYEFIIAHVFHLIVFCDKYCCVCRTLKHSFETYDLFLFKAPMLMPATFKHLFTRK